MIHYYRPLFNFLVLVIGLGFSAGAQADPLSKKIKFDSKYALSSQLAPILSDPLLSKSVVGIHIVNVRSKEEVFSYNADKALIPASVMKAVTSAVALKNLGPDFRFKTKFYTVGEIKNGVLRGDLHIVGGGDPTLLTEDLWKIVHELQMKGLTRISGNVYYDNNLFAGSKLIPGWGKRVDIANGPSYFPLTSALSVNWNNVSIKVRPGDQVGKKAKVYFEFPAPFLKIKNEVKTGAAKSRPHVEIARSLSNDVMTYTLKGSIPKGTQKPWTYYRTVHRPADYFSHLMKTMMKAKSLSVSGRHLIRKRPATSNLFYTRYSQPLRELIAYMNKHSQNLIAEHLMLQLGVQAKKGSAATTQDGLDVVSKYIKELGVMTQETRLVNGSGLSRHMKIPASSISALMMDMYDAYTLNPEYMSSLAVGGSEGTLRRRFKEPQFFGRVRGKTGSLNGVYCLASYVWSDDDEIYAMVYLANDLQGPSAKARKLQDRLIRHMLDGFSQKKGGI